MASPLKPGKQPVALAADGVRVSRIRRDPPPVKKTVVPHREELDRRTVPIGILTFALAIVVVILAFGSWAGWSPSHHPIHIKQSS